MNGDHPERSKNLARDPEVKQLPLCELLTFVRSFTSFKMTVQ